MRQKRGEQKMYVVVTEFFGCGVVLHCSVIESLSDNLFLLWLL